MESVGVHWIPLKLRMLPFIVQETDKVIEKCFSELSRVGRAGK